MMPPLINWGLISNPFNWLAIFVMAASVVIFWTAVRNSLLPFSQGE